MATIEIKTVTDVEVDVNTRKCETTVTFPEMVTSNIVSQLDDHDVLNCFDKAFVMDHFGIEEE